MSATKVISDPIHASIELPPCLLELIDTREFQRLRGLKQLGATHYVFPSATHTRFEHSIGVAHLGMKLARTIMNKQPELGITEQDIHCVGIAGLCHDLGHGPFSHMFDGEFMKGRSGGTWTHEFGSVMMLRHLLRVNGIKSGVCSSPNEMVFVEEMILGGKTRVGRAPNKAFLYDIINNERSGLDVDKLDYIFRDSYYTGVNATSGVSVERIVQMARVLPDEDGVLTISFPTKMVHALFGVFHARTWLHQIVYQHKVVKSLEYMIRDALAAADSRLQISESVRDMAAFAKLKDSILDIIEHGSDVDPSGELAVARGILDRIAKRDIYHCCGYHEIEESKGRAEGFAEQIACELANLSNSAFVREDIIVEVMTVHHGKGTSQNPMNGLRFYNKEHDSARCFKISQQACGGALFPKQMGTMGIRVFAKQAHLRASVTRCFENFWTD